MPRRKKQSHKIKFRVYVSDKIKNNIRYIAVYMDNGNHLIEQILSLDSSEREIGSIQRGWKVLSGLMEDYDTSRVELVTDLEVLKNIGVTTIDSIYNYFWSELQNCDMNDDDYDITVRYEGDNPASRLIDEKAKGFMDYKFKSN